MLVAHELYRFYHVGESEVMALRGVSLVVAPGETVAVMGPSGSGKSTLLACLAGLDEPSGGHVDILGTRLTRKPERVRAAMRAQHIGMLLQSGNLIAHMSVADNVRFVMRLARCLDHRKVATLLEQVGLADRAHAYPAELSGGETARAGLATALAATPPLLLADEPTGEVDAETERRILDVFAARRAAGGAALIVTHSDALAARADRVLRLADGRLINAASFAGCA